MRFNLWFSRKNDDAWFHLQLGRLYFNIWKKNSLGFRATQYFPLFHKCSNGVWWLTWNRFVLMWE